MRLPRIVLRVDSVSPAFDNHSKCELKLDMILNMYGTELVSRLRQVIPSDVAADFEPGVSYEAHFVRRVPPSKPEEDKP